MLEQNNRPDQATPAAGVRFGSRLGKTRATPSRWNNTKQGTDRDDIFDGES
jgi:hypothetical protein